MATEFYQKHLRPVVEEAYGTLGEYVKKTEQLKNKGDDISLAAAETRERIAIAVDTALRRYIQNDLVKQSFHGGGGPKKREESIGLIVKAKKKKLAEILSSVTGSR